MNLNKLINFYSPSPSNHQKTYGFLMISGGIKINQFALIRLSLEVKFADGPLCNHELFMIVLFNSDKIP